MESIRISEVHKRLQRDEEYQHLKRGADKIQQHLMLEMTERQRELFLDFLTARELMRTHEWKYCCMVARAEGSC